MVGQEGREQRDAGADDTRIENCQVSNVDTGVFLDADRGEVEDNDVVDVGSGGVHAVGDAHSVRGNEIREMAWPFGSAIEITGSRPLVTRNLVQPFAIAGVPAEGIRIGPVGEGIAHVPVVQENQIFNATSGIVLDAGAGEIGDVVVVDNVVVTAAADGIRFDGPVRGGLVAGNDVEGFGPVHGGILLNASGAGPSAGITVSGNTVFGNGTPAQIGIGLFGGSVNEVVSNLQIENVAIGIADRRGFKNVVTGNFLSGGSVGIDVLESVGRTLADGGHVFGNVVVGAETGIRASGAGSPFVEDNIVAAAEIGVEVAGVTGEPDESGVVPLASIRGNDVTPTASGRGLVVVASDAAIVEGNAVSGGSIGLAIEASDAATVEGNAVRGGAIGLAVEAGAGVDVLGNDFEGQAVCASASGSTSIDVTGNRFSGCTDAGLVLSAADSADVAENTFEDTAVFGLVYASGTGATIELNTFDVAGGDRGIVVGDLTAPGGVVSALTIQDQDVEGFDFGVTFGFGVEDAQLLQSRVVAADTAVDGQVVAYAPGTLEIRGNTLTGGVFHAAFLAPVDAIGNTWGDTPLPDLIDEDGDGVSDCGADHVYSSTDYSGTQAGAAKTSTTTRQVSDRFALPVFAGTCPP